MPFAEHAGGVARFFQLRSDRVAVQWKLGDVIDRSEWSFGPIETINTADGVDTCSSRMLSPEDRSACGGTVLAMVVIQEANALGCQSIDVGGFVVLASVASQVGISEVIGQNENDVWPRAARWVARRWIGQQFDRTQAQQADEQAAPDRA